MVMVQMAVVLAAVPKISAQELSYQEIATLNMKLEPATEHFDRGDGFLYGASSDVGHKGGMIYRLAPGQPVEVLHEFEAVDYSPKENDNGAGRAQFMAEGPDGALYGTTDTGGAEGLGVLFRYDINGCLSIIDSPKASGMPTPTDLVVTASGDIYGISDRDDGGTNGGNNYGGSLFRRAADGSVAILHVFNRPPFVPSPNPGVRPLPPFTPPEPGPVVDPYHPHRICEGPDGKLYGITFSGGTGHGAFFSFDLTAGTLEVLADLGEYNDWPREMSPAEGGFHVLLERHLLHISYDGTVEMAVDGTAPPIYQGRGTDFRGPIVQTADGVFVESAYGGANNAGYVARFRPGEGATVAYNYPVEAKEMQRRIAAGADGKIYGLIEYPEDYVPPATAVASASATTAKRSSATAQAAPIKKAVAMNPKSFRFRKAGDSDNFLPFAQGDSAWLPAKASKAGTREVILDILSNDGDPDEDPLAVSSVVSEGSGSATLIQTKRGPRLKVVTTEANPASQRVTYQLSDGNGGTSTGSVAILSPITATFSGAVLPAAPDLPAGTITVKISGRHAITATFTLADKKFTGRGVLDVNETTDIQLKLRGQSPIVLRADLNRSGVHPQLNVFLPFGGTVYSAILTATPPSASR